jgi:hypothetical protein
LARFFDELHEPLYCYFLCCGVPPDDADDGVQKTFLRLHQHLSKQGDGSNLRGWVFQVVPGDLQVLVKSVYSDPRYGTTTYELTNLLAAPDAALFQPPAGYEPREDRKKEGSGGGGFPGTPVLPPPGIKK